MKLLRTTLLLFFIATAPTVAFLFAQSSTGRVVGTVKNAAGMAVPNATVELHSATTGARITAVADSAGSFQFESVPVGTYRLSANPGTGMMAPGREFTVELNRQVTINVVTGGAAPTADRTAATPAPATATDTVTSAETVDVSRNTAAISTYFGTTPIQHLPQPNFVSREGSAFGAYNLSLLSEGVTSGGMGEARGPAVGGQRPISNNFHLDGIDNNNKVLPGPLVYISNEATSDFVLMQAQPTPLFGHSAGGKMNSAVRTGTNQVHGSAYWYLQNRHLNAMDPGLGRLGFEENPRYDQNRIGGSLGVPIVPSKLFFFGNFEYIPLGFTRVNRAGVYAPTQAGFSTLANMPGISATNLGILQSSLGAATTATRTTTVGGASIPLGLVASSVSGFQNQYVGTGAMDWNINTSSKLQARYVHNEFDTSAAGGGLPGFMTPMQGKSLLATVAYQQNITAAVTNELRLGYNRFANTVAPGNLTFAGEPFPNISIQEGLNLSLGPQVNLPDNAAVNTYHLADALNWRIGSHQLRFGIDGRRYISSLSGFPQTRGAFTFSNLERFVRDLSPDVASERLFGGSYASNNQYLWFAYIQDTWNVMPNLSLDLGLRYQYATIPEQFKRQALNSFAGVPGLLEFNEPNVEQLNFAPQVGIAWSPGGSNTTVIRSGFSMAYDTLYGQNWMNPIAPGLGYTAFGNLQSNSPGFFRSGGLQNNFVNQADITPAQARSQITSFISDQKMPYVMHWNAGVQQGLWRNFTAEVKYIGSRGVNLPWLTYFNVTPQVTADRSLPLFTDQPTQAQLNQLDFTLNELQQPIPNAFTQAGFTSPITTIRNEGNSWYHGLALTLNQRFAGGFHLQGNYTYSHLIDDATGTGLDLTTVGRERASSIFDRRHRVTATSLFDVWSLLGDRPGVLGSIFANFTLGGTYTYESPQYVTPLSGLDTGFMNAGLTSRALINPNATGNGGTDVTALRNSMGQIVAYQTNDPNARFIRGAAGIFAAGGRNSLRLGETNNFDISAVKRFSYRDRAGIEIRADAYNIFNHPQYTGGSLTSIDFRNFSAAQPFFVPGTEEFGNAASLLPANNRTLQLALRVTF